MKKLFVIDEIEKKRILEMHETASKKNYMSEQVATQPNTTPTGTNIEGKYYKLPGIVDKTTLENFTGKKEFTQQDLDNLNSFLGPNVKLSMLSPDGRESGLGKNALSLVVDGLNYLAEVVSKKEKLCRGAYTKEQFYQRLPEMKTVNDELASITKKSLADVINNKIKTSQYCKS